MTTGEPRFPPSAKWSEVWPSYEWPRDTEEQDIDYVYHGRMEALPKSTAKIVRIFLSSTFTDTVVERNMLMKQVFPEMRQYCRDQYDLDFQVVDMRWGVRQEASVDHSASELCMREIKNCDEVSLGPTFVTLLSHRYGSRPLRVRIPEAEMDILLTEMRKRGPEDEEHVLEWYQLDTNAVPPEYILKPLVKFEDVETSIERQDKVKRKNKTKKNVDIEIVDDDESISSDTEPDDGDSNDELDELSRQEYMSLLKTGTHLFNEAQPRLKRIFEEVAKHCLSEGLLMEEQAERYCISVTEEEIIEGVRKNERRRDRCLAFIRELTDINTQHPLAWRFIDMDGDKVDDNAQQLMIKLKDDTIPKLLPKENIFRFRAAWSNDKGVNERQHIQYLQQFCDTFKTALKEQIDRGVKASKFIVDGLFSEILEHAHQCVGKVQRFYGRDDVLDTIRDYLMSASDKPLVIWGESGCGKTSVLAKAAKMTPCWLGDNNLLIPVRFLGTTPESSTIYRTLASISRQLIRLCGLNELFPVMPQEFADLKDMFKDILAAIPESKRLVLFVDSLDQLSEANGAHRLQWLPLVLPSNVKFILSVLPKEHGVLDKLRTLLPGEKQYVEIANLKTDTSHKILKIWLDMQHRKLSNAQEKQIDALIAKDVPPLYLKLVFDEIHSWKSFEESNFDCSNISDCLWRLYRRLETKHGKTLVSKALGFLSASASGLTELEMEDILSLDEEVLTDVYQYHIPPIRRLPSILWARVRRDLDEYIVDREADGTKVMAWYHRQFIEQANRRYLGVAGAFSRTSGAIRKKNKAFYLTLRDYFAGTWAGNKPKPFKYTDYQMRKLNKKKADGKEIRYVSAQPPIFKSPDGSIDIENPRYNLRKLSELPPACRKLSDQFKEDMLAFVIKHILLNPEFLCSWIKNKPWEEVSEFVSGILNKTNHSVELKEYTNIFKKQFDDEKLTDEEIETLNKAEHVLEGESWLVLQMSTIYSCLLLSYISVLQNPTFFHTDVCGRLLIYHGVMGKIDDWVRHCDTEGRELCALVPPHLQLETPGSELLFFINNHDGPVINAMWHPNDKKICYSFSSKLVAVSLVFGQCTINTRPRSIPRGETFNKAQFIDLSDFNDCDGIKSVLGILNSELLLASLMNRPWLYVFTVSGDFVRCIKCEEVLKDELEALGIQSRNLRISDMKSVQVDDCILVLYDESLPHLIYLTRDFTLRLQPLPTSGKVAAIARIKIDADLLPLIFDDTGDVYAYKNDTKRVMRQFGSAITAHQERLFDGRTIVVCGLENGRVMLLALEDDECDIHHVEEFGGSDQRGHPVYGVPHSVCVRAIEGYSNKYVKKLAYACTSSHLLLLVPQIGLENSISSESESDWLNSDASDDPEYESEREKNRQEKTKSKAMLKRMKLVLRVKKKYHIAEITPSFNLLIAAKGGQLDLFQLNISRSAATHSRISGFFFTTVDAHAQDITQILTTEADFLLMTASRDSTLKYWMLAKAGVTKKYIPNFDRAEVGLTRVVPDKEHALAAGDLVRSLQEWNVVKGRMERQFSHPSRCGRFPSFAPDEQRNTLYAIDMSNNLYAWSLELHATTGKRLKRRTTKTAEGSVQEAVKVTHVPPAGLTDLKECIEPEGQLLIECAVSGGLIVCDQNSTYYHIVIDDKVKVTKIELKYNRAKMMKLDTHSVVIIATNNSNNWICYVYHITKGIEHVSKFNLAISNKDKLTMSPTGEIIIPTEDELVFHEPKTGKQRTVSMRGLGKKFSVVTCATGVCVVYCNQTLTYRGIHVTPTTLTLSDWIRKLSRDEGDTLEYITITHDGKYVLCVTNEKMMRLIRYSDGKLLALYTMHAQVCSLNVSTNNHYVLIGTLDNRLFTLVIADPREREHDERIKYVRDKNPGLSHEQAMALIAESNNFEGGYEDLMRAAEIRLNKTWKTDPNMTFCLRSDDESSSESDIDSRTSTSQGLRHHETTMVIKYENGMQPTAHDGQIFTPTPCTLQ